MKKKQKITKNTNIRELITKYPQVAPILLEYGLQCVGCASNIYDTVESGAKIHGLTDKDIGRIVERLNKTI